MPKRNLVVLTGAGMSAESGVKTFRDNNGLWEEHRVEDVATPEAFARDPKLVHHFYNLRRAQLQQVEPNTGHRILAELESDFNVQIITQNVDNLHERAGSTKVMHLHGELTKVRSTVDESLIYDWPGELTSEDRNEEGHPLRPHIVWFGEAVPMIEPAARLVANAHIIVIIGTSMQVYPAAGLVGLADPDVPIYYIDPNPTISHELRMRQELDVLEMGASEGMTKLKGLLLN
ncbi:NAD-dependent protein deacylase [Lewinellaceae bacterium SD302]|nr:NAD-dependent protein deacylase [Lewinellaceae bacterium SD302]